MKKVISALVMSALLITVCPAAFGAETMSISNTEEFSDFLKEVSSKNSGLNAVLQADIDISSLENCTVGTEQTPYSGTFDGNGHKISGYTVSGAEKTAGLFACIDIAGTVKNLSVEGNVSCTRAAGIAGVNSGRIDNVRNFVTVMGTQNTGGICAENRGTIVNCENLGDVYILGQAAGGGICAKNSGSVLSCSNYGKVSGNSGNLFSEHTGGIAGENTGIIEDCTNAAAVSGGNYTAGISAFNEGAFSVLKVLNFGGVSGLTNYTAGIAAFAGGDGKLSGTKNYGSVKGYGTHTAGIAADCKVPLSDSENHGPVSGSDYVAGILALAENTAVNCTNYAESTGASYVGGIAAHLNGGSLSVCRNFGRISADSHFAGGIAALAENAAIETCMNFADIFGAVSGAGNFAAGAIAKMTASSAQDIASVGNVTGRDTVGGVVGYKEGSLTCAFKLDCYDGAVLNDTNKEQTAFVYARSDYNYQTGQAPLFDSGALAWTLNTQEETVPSRNVWSQGEEGYPVLADSFHKPVKKIICRLNGGETVYYTNADGRITLDETTQNPDAHFYNEIGTEVGRGEILVGESVEATVFVTNGEAFLNALNDEQVREITLAEDIVLSGPIPVSRGVKITGNGKQLLLKNNGFVLTDGALVLENLSIQASGAAASMTGGSLEVRGFCNISKSLGLRMSGGTFRLSGRLYNALESETNPSMIIDGTAAASGVERYVANENNEYFYHRRQKSGFAWDIVIPAAQNGLACDLYPSYGSEYIYFFLPCNTDLSSVCYQVRDIGGTVLNTYENVDLSGGLEPLVDVKMKQFKIKALKSSLPTLQITIDENFGRIEDMNSSADHSAKCYGDLTLTVTEQDAKEKGFQNIVSKDKKEDTPGSLEIRGRGNYTWTSDLSDKKPYQFKLEEKEDLLGMGAAKTWILLKNNNDLIKNKLGLDLAKEIGLDFTADSEFVDLFMNGQYLGNYLLTEKVEVGKQRVNITDIDDKIKKEGLTPDTDLTGGYLLEIDNSWDELLQIRHNNIWITVKSPEKVADKVSEDNGYAYIQERMTNILDSVFTDGKMPNGRSYLDYIDPESFAKYFWHQEFLKNGDCGRGSTFFYKDRDNIDPFIYAGPIWDNDRILEGNYPEGWYLNTIDIAGTTFPTFYHQLSKRRDFVKYLIYYYENSNLKEVFAKANEKIDEYKAYLAESAKMNSLRWGIHDLSIDWYKPLLVNRAKWIDEHYKTLLDETEPDENALHSYFENNNIVLEFSNTEKKNKEYKALIAQYDAEGRLIAVDLVPFSVKAEEPVKTLTMKRNEVCRQIRTYILAPGGGVLAESGMRVK